METELGFKHGFYGLNAAGWDIAETTGASPRGRLPEEAIKVEYIVAALSAERTGASACMADEFNQLAASFASAKALPPPRKLTDIELGRTRSRMDALFVRWRTLPPGETLELPFLP